MPQLFFDGRRAAKDFGQMSSSVDPTRQPMPDRLPNPVRINIVVNFIQKKQNLQLNHSITIIISFFVFLKKKNIQIYFVSRQSITGCNKR